MLQGSDELTDGIDIVPLLREDNLRLLERALEDIKARRADGKPLALERDLARLPVLELATAAGELKLVPGAGGDERLRRSAPAREAGADRPGTATLGCLARRPRAHALCPRPRPGPRTPADDPPPDRTRTRTRSRPLTRTLSPARSRTNSRRLPVSITGETQMHHDAETSTYLCTVYGCRAAASAAEARRHKATSRRHRRPSRTSSYANRRGSSGSPTPAPRPPKHLGSAAPPSPASCLYIDTIETPWDTTLVPVDELERLLAERRRPRHEPLRPNGPAGRLRSASRSSNASAPRAPPEEATARSRGHSTRTVSRPPTEAASGGRRRYAPLSSAQSPPTSAEISKRPA